MLHIYINVSGMLQVFHLDVCIYSQWLHTCFKKNGVFASVSDIYCKCVYLDVIKVDRILHMLQWDTPTVAIEASPWSPCGRLRPADASAAQHPQRVR